MVNEIRFHEYLKKAAVLWLFNRRCYLAGTEIYIPRSNIESIYNRISMYRKHKQYIDACGVGFQYKSQFEDDEK